MRHGVVRPPQQDLTTEEAGERIAQLTQALGSREVVGQATGVLIALHRISATDAWDRLAETSQRNNIKLIRLARAVVAIAERRATPCRTLRRRQPPGASVGRTPKKGLT